MAGLVALVVLAARAQGTDFRPAGQYTADRLTTQDGLIQNSVHGLAMDRDGHLWIGTLRGVSRYDGHGFVHFTERNTPGMPSAGITSLAAADDGSIWIGTTKGLHRLKPGGSGVVYEAGINDYCNKVLSLGDAVIAGGRWGLVHGRPGHLQQVGPPLEVQTMAAPAGSALWIAAAQGLWRMPLPLSDPDSRPQLVLPGGCGMNMATRGQTLWVRVGEDLCQVDARSGVVEQRWPGLNADPMLADRQGNLWLTRPTSNGYDSLGVLDAGLGQFVPCPPGSGIPGAVTSAGLEDPTGTVWWGTFADGLARLRPRLVRSFDTRDGLPHRDIRAVQASPQAGLWVSTAGGTARQAGDRFEVFGENWEVRGPSLLGLSQDSVLVASHHLFHAVRGQPTANAGPDALRFLFVQRDRAGRPVTGNSTNIWCQVGPGHWIQETNIPGAGHWTSWQEGPGREVFLGSFDRGLFRRVGDGNWSHVDLPGGPSAAVVLWWEDGRRPWVGSTTGLYRRRDAGGWDHWTEEHGLDEDLVMAIEPDDAGNLWLLGHEGIHRVAIASLLAVAEGRESKVRTLTLDTRNGLPSNEGNAGTPSSARDREGQLWFATSAGLVRIRPSEIPPPARPRPLITQVLTVGNEALPSPVSPERAQPVVFTRGEGRHLRFKFTAPLPSSAHRVHLQFRLAGANDAWIQADASREATFVALKPGRHHFEVLAAADDGPWSNEPARWSFDIRPFWWERTDLRLGAAALALGVASLLVRRRFRLQAELASLRQARGIEDERRRLARDMHDNLGAELARINLAASTGPVDAGKMSRNLMHRLQTLVWLTDPSEDRLDVLLHSLATRVEGFFPNGLPAVHVEIPAAIPAHPIDGRVRRELVAWLDEALANIARHAGARNVRFQAHSANGNLVVVVSDDGCGFLPSKPDPAPGGGHGLANLKARIDALGGKLGIHSAPGQGTQLEASVPIPPPSCA